MKYRIEKTESEKYKVAILNQSFGFEKVFTFDTKEDAQQFIELAQGKSRERLSQVPTIKDYFQVE